MKTAHFLVALAVLALASSIASAYDPHSLQDYCVAVNDPKQAVFVNGKVCKDPKLATSDDFLFSGLNIPLNTNNVYGFNVTTVDASLLPGLNTLGSSFLRLDFAPNGGVTPPHTHPRATEVLYIAEGIFYAGFVTSGDNRLITKILHPGDVFVFPIGLIHFQLNISKKSGVIFGSFNSQNPGFISAGESTFGTNPSMNPDVLTRSFRLDKEAVIDLQKKFLKEKFI